MTSTDEETASRDRVLEKLGADWRQAGFMTRFGAFMVDILIIIVLSLMIGAVMLAMNYPPLEHAGTLALFALAFSWLYSAGMESSFRQGTVGKIILSLKVVDLDAERISFAQASMRYLAKLLSALTLGAGFIMVAFNDRKRALHDIIAGTAVVRPASLKKDEQTVTVF